MVITLVSSVIINHNSQNLRWLVLLMPGGFKGDAGLAGISRVWPCLQTTLVFLLVSTNIFFSVLHPISFPRASDSREGTQGSGIIRCRKPGILAKIELRIPFQRPIRLLPETDYPRASRSLPRITGSGNKIVLHS
jgi:hypothetical protein